MATQTTETTKETLIPIAQDGVIGVRYVDKLVSDAASQPLGQEEFSALQLQTIRKAHLTLYNIKKVIASRLQAGRYNSVLEAIPPHYKESSVRSNLLSLGIELP